MPIPSSIRGCDWRSTRADDPLRCDGEGGTLFLEIGPRTKPCLVPAGSQCLYARKLHYGVDGARTGQSGDGHVLAQNIEGYTHAPGVRNVLRVKRYKIANPPADAPSTAYVLDMVIETAPPPRAS
ncbi:MAG: DUF4377 domain-containing protein [Xanthomonadaceae bacterium]|nr:DUF4377 domain-containing protein [Xanthomonadaceae bacterium]